MEGLSARREQLQKDLSLETDAEKRNKLYEELVSIVLAENADKVKTIKELGEQLMESKPMGGRSHRSYEDVVKERIFSASSYQSWLISKSTQPHGHSINDGSLHQPKKKSRRKS